LSQHIKDFCEDRARKGDAGFAIAYALIDLADAQEATAKALQRLGMADAATPMGAVENLSLEVKNAGALISEAIERASSASQ
jgi:hypothetical protein